MSKVISFSISDRYLDKLRSLYPSLTDNLAAKQFLTDGLESSLGNSLDDGLDDSLDGKLKSLIESELNDLLEGRLDAVVGKSLTSLSDRLSRLEERLDTKLDDRLDDMEPLLKLQQSASIASPIPTGETSHDEPVTDAIETVTPEVSPSPLSPGTDAIASVTGNGMTSAEAHRFLISKNVKIASRSLDNWIRDSKIPKSRQGKEAEGYIYIKDKRYYAIE